MTPTTQLESESNKAYEAFRNYLGMGRQRTHRKVAQQLRTSATNIHHMARRYKWRERISSSMLEDRQIEQGAKAVAALETARDLEARQKQVENDALELSEKFIDKLREMLRFPVVTARKTKTEESEDGKVTHTHITYQPAKWTFADIIRIMQGTDALRRLALDMPLGRHEVTGKDGAPLSPAAQPIINVIHQYDKRTVEARKLFGSVRPPGRTD